MLRFGPAGASPLFYASGGNSSVQVPAWLAGLGLQAYEYQCTRGVNVKEDTATAVGVEAGRYGIHLTLHAPYYINLAAEGKTRDTTKSHLIRSLRAAAWMGASRVVFHPGAATPDRGQAMIRAERLLQEVLQEAAELGLTGAALSLETMGKRNVLGTLQEVTTLCRSLPQVKPTIDFGHLYAREIGRLTTVDDYRRILGTVADILGPEALQDLHIHFSPVEYTGAGERRHRNLKAGEFGPKFEPLAQALLDCGVKGTVICESADSQVEDALVYQHIWQQVSGGGN